MSEPLVLASSSPRRSELLKQLGLDFHILACEVDEIPPAGLCPSEAVEVISLRKALAAAAKVEQGLIIGADTMVVCRGIVLGKPSDREDAVAILKTLQGAWHEVYTGVALVRAGRGDTITGHERTWVLFKSITESKIRNYVSTGEPMDKAGAYAIQGLGAVFIRHLEGCYSNVVGLPLARLEEMLKIMGVKVI